MQFRIFEINETEKFQFLMIQKNGATSVCQCILEKFPNQSWASTGPVKNKPRFAIIRDPYERFISGLKYDFFQLYQKGYLALIFFTYIVYDKLL